MSALSLRLPDSIHNEARKLSRADGGSLNQFIAVAIAEKIAAMRTESWLKEKAKEGSKADFVRVLGKVKARKVLPGDK